MSGTNWNNKVWTDTDIRAAAMEAASRVFQGEGVDIQDFIAGPKADIPNTVERKLFDLAEKIAKYIDRGEKPR